MKVTKIKAINKNLNYYFKNLRPESMANYTKNIAITNWLYFF